MSYNNVQQTMTSTSDANTVLSKTFRLLGLSMIPTVIMAYLVSLIPMHIYQQNPIGSAVALIVLFIVSIGLMFWAVKQKNESTAVTAFMTFAGIMGAILGPTIMMTMNKPDGFQSIIMAASLTGVALFGLTAYAMKSKRDFSFMGGFLFAGLIVLIAGGILQMFFPNPMVHFLLTIAGVIIFIAYILYDVSKIVTGGQTNHVFAAFALYLDILNLFSYLLRLISGKD